jgi:hypothetical protein
MGCVYLIRGQLTGDYLQATEDQLHTKATSSFYKCLVGTTVPAHLVRESSNQFASPFYMVERNERMATELVLHAVQRVDR